MMTAKPIPSKSLVNDSSMVLTSPRSSMGRSARKLLLRLHDLVNGIGNSTQITTIRVRVDVISRLYVIVIDHNGRDISLQRCQIRQQLAVVACGRGDGRSLQCLEGVDSILRALNNHLVVHSVLRVEPLVRCGLATPGERDQHAVRDITLLKPNPLSFVSVNVHLDRGIRDPLVDVNIHSTGNSLDLAQKVFCDLKVLYWVSANHLKIDGSGETEV